MFAGIQRATGTPFDVHVFKDEKDCKANRSQKGYFKIVMEPDGVAIIYYMYIKPKHRKKGYAAYVLDGLKISATKIITQVSSSSQQSIDYLKQQGFKKEGDWLVWTK